MFGANQSFKTMNHLPDNLLFDYVRGFYGYGSGRAKMWFVGMEEGGGWSIEDVHGRLMAWNKARSKKLQDLRRFHLARGETRWHCDPPQLQRTWKQLIRMFLLAHGEADTWTELLHFQRHAFGRSGGSVCTIELLPLPSPGLDTWHYGSWSKLTWLKKRECYTEFVLRDRVCNIRKAINHYQPPVIIFYGSSWLRYWSMIAQVEWKQAILGKLLGGEREGVAYYVTRHPARQSDAYFSEIGKFLRRAHGKQI
jgi:hypothetical protein